MYGSIEIRNQGGGLANPGLPGKWLLKWCVLSSVICMMICRRETEKMIRFNITVRYCFIMYTVSDTKNIPVQSLCDNFGKCGQIFAMRCT